jgi:hypothetical protein
MHIFLLSTFLLTIYGQVQHPRRLFRDAGIVGSSKKLRLPPISNSELIVAAAAYDAAHPGPSRFGEAVEMHAEMSDGEWSEDQERNVRVWRLQISSPGAITLSILFDDFHIPDHGEFYVIGLNVSDIASQLLGNKGGIHIRKQS